MNCPSCQSSDVTRAAVEWEKGTKIAVRGAGKPNVRRVGDLQQNLTAFKLSPPDAPKARVWLAIGMIIAFMVLATRLSTGAPSVQPWLAMAALFGPLAWCVADRRKQARGHAQAVAHWNRLWFCNRCGHVADDAEFRASPALNSGLIGSGPVAGLVADH